VADGKNKEPRPYIESETFNTAADPVVAYMSKDQLQKAIQKTKKSMEAAVKELDFIEAARLRDEMFAFQKLIDGK
jgi:excinuclease ABC subunit B